MALLAGGGVDGVGEGGKQAGHIATGEFASGEALAHVRLGEHGRLDASVAYCARTDADELRAGAGLTLVMDDSAGFRLGFVYIDYHALGSYIGVSLSRALATLQD